MISLLLVLAAQQELVSGPTEKWERARQSERSSIVQAIIKDCKLPPKALKVKRGGEVVMQPAPDTEYPAIKCMVDRVRQQIGFHKVGIVGNAVLTEEKK